MIMKRKMIISICALIGITLLVWACGGDTKNKTTSPKGIIKDYDPPTKPLNITIFIDLSNRIVRPSAPSQQEKDLSIVRYLVDYFVNQTKVVGWSNCKHSMQVLFYPTPNLSNMQELSENLTMDMSKLTTGREKHEKLDNDNMQNVFQQSLEEIYQQTLADRNYLGCDIWGYFSDNKVDAVVRDGYRNILFILTDGYIYDTKYLIEENGSLSYIPENSKRQKPLIVKRGGLQDLEVRMLEINPVQPKDFAGIKTILEDWLQGMDIPKENISIIQTDNNLTTTKTQIDNILQQQ